MMNNILLKSYYRIKPFIPRELQIILRRGVAMEKRRRNGHCWPIDAAAAKSPELWDGWPEGKKFAVVLTHDVDTRRGHDRCLTLMGLEVDAGFNSSFNFVGGEYEVAGELRNILTANGFEVGVHGWLHNASLYESEEEFKRQAARINSCLEEWGAVGFRSPCMYRNLEWLRGLNVSYDASTFDTDPFEPQSDGAGTIFPFVVGGYHEMGGGYVELPYTLPQDFTLFVLFREKNIDIWKRKLDWVAANGGMVLLNTHPDYMSFASGNTALDTYPSSHYQELLSYLKERYAGEYWHALPREVAKFWKQRYGDIPQQPEPAIREGAFRAKACSVSRQEAIYER